MPKFLDAPSWYDETGTLRTLSGTVRFNSLAGFVDLPYTTFASGGARSSYYVLTSAGTNGNIAYSNGSYPMWLSNGTRGQVLTSNGNAAPSWADIDIPPLYMHKIYLYASSIAFRAIATVYSMSSTSITNNTVDDLLTFLNDNGCTGKSNFLPINGCLTGVVAVGIYNNYEKTRLYVVTFNASSGSASEDLGEFTNMSVTNKTEVRETIIAM